MAGPIIVEREGVVLGAARGRVDDFARVVRRGDRLWIAVADAHTCGWDADFAPIARPVLDAAERAPTIDDAFAAARAAFEVAAAPYPEDHDVGSPAAQLTIVELSPGRLRSARLGAIGALVVGEAEHRDPLESPFEMIERTARALHRFEAPLAEGDLVILAHPWVGFVADTLHRLPPSRVIADLARAHAHPRALVEAALAQHTRDVAARIEARALIGEPSYVIAASGSPSR